MVTQHRQSARNKIEQSEAFEAGMRAALRTLYPASQQLAGRTALPNKPFQNCGIGSRPIALCRHQKEIHKISTHPHLH